MAEYNVTAPDGTRYKVTGPEGASDAEIIAKAKAMHGGAPKAPATAPQPAQNEAEDDSALGFIGGNLNKGIASLAGLPVDTARNIANLGIAGAGYAGSKLGMFDAGDAPQPLEPGPGSSEWFEGLGRKGGLITPSADPTSPGGRIAAAGIQAIPSALLGKPNVAQLPRAVTGAVTSGVGGQIGAEIAPEGYESVGSTIGSLAPGAHEMSSIPTPPMRGAKARQAEAYATAKKSGIPVAPRDMKIDPIQVKIEAAAVKELGMPEGTPATPKVMKSFRAQQYDDGYKPIIEDKDLKGDGILTTTTFRAKMRALQKEESALREEFGGKKTDPVLRDLFQNLEKPSFSTSGTMKQIQRLRESATNNFSSVNATDATKALARAQREMANHLENLVEENLAYLKKPDLIQNFRDARVKMAQAHAIEGSLDPVTGKINPQELSRIQSEDATLSGKLKDIAEITSAFPGAVAPTREQKVFTERVTPMAVKEPVALGAHMTARLIDPITKSRPYQNLFVDPNAKLTADQQRLMRLGVGAEQADQIPYPP